MEVKIFKNKNTREIVAFATDVYKHWGMSMKEIAKYLNDDNMVIVGEYADDKAITINDVFKGKEYTTGYGRFIKNGNLAEGVKLQDEFVNSLLTKEDRFFIEILKIEIER